MNIVREQGSVSTVIAIALWLIAPPLVAQSPPPTWYSPKTTESDLAAEVPTQNGALLAGCGITVSVTPQPNTNAHLHEGPPGVPTVHPFSTLSSSDPGSSVSADGSTLTGYTGNDGLLHFSLTTTLVGQDEVISVSSPCAIYTNAYPYTVGYNDLVYGASVGWVPIGGTDAGVDTGHGTTMNNRYMTQATYNALYSTYAAWAAQSDNCRICVNDAALPSGGKFDIQAIKADKNGLYHPWTQPHIAHDRGSAVDIAVSTSHCQYPVNASMFLLACKQNGFNSTTSITEPVGSAIKDHVHCNTLPAGSYPE